MLTTLWVNYELIVESSQNGPSVLAYNYSTYMWQAYFWTEITLVFGLILLLVLVIELFAANGHMVHYPPY